MLEVIKINVLDYLFARINVWMVKKVDPISKTQFERQIIILNFLFTVFNHFAIIFLIRIYLANIYKQCNLVNPDDVLKILCKQQYSPNILMCTDEVQHDSEYFYHVQKISIGCMSEIKNYFGSYIVINFVISIIRIIFTNLQKKKIYRKQAQDKKEFEEFYALKARFFEKYKTQKTMKLNQSKKQETLLDLNDFTNKGLGKGENTVQDSVYQTENLETQQNDNKIFETNDRDANLNTSQKIGNDLFTQSNNEANSLNQYESQVSRRSNVSTNGS